MEGRLRLLRLFEKFYNNLPTERKTQGISDAWKASLTLKIKMEEKFNLGVAAGRKAIWVKAKK